MKLSKLTTSAIKFFAVAAIFLGSMFLLSYQRYDAVQEEAARTTYLITCEDGTRGVAKSVRFHASHLRVVDLKGNVRKYSTSVKCVVFERKIKQ